MGDLGDPDDRPPSRLVASPLLEAKLRAPLADLTRQLGEQTVLIAMVSTAAVVPGRPGTEVGEVVLRLIEPEGA